VHTRARLKSAKMPVPSETFAERPCGGWPIGVKRDSTAEKGGTVWNRAELRHHAVWNGAGLGDHAVLNRAELRHHAVWDGAGLGDHAVPNRACFV
jgi:hypothetical protein